MFGNFILRESGDAVLQIYTCAAAGLGCPMGTNWGCSTYNQIFPREIPPLHVSIGKFMIKSAVTDYFCHSREKFVVSKHLKVVP